MQEVILKIILSLVTKLLTERFIAKLTVRLLWFFAERTPFEIDDGIVEDIAKSLGIDDYK